MEKLRILYAVILIIGVVYSVSADNQTNNADGKTNPQSHNHLHRHGNELHNHVHTHKRMHKKFNHTHHHDPDQHQKINDDEIELNNVN